MRTTDDPISRQTLKQLDAVMGWPAGTAAGILAGEAPPNVGAPVHDDESTLLYERPKGLTDAEWAELRRTTGEYIEWQLNRLSQGR